MHFDYKIHYDFIKNRKKFYTGSILLVVIGIVSLLIFQMNLGIDFKSGTTMDAVADHGVTQAEVIEVLTGLGYDETPTVGGENNERISIRFGDELAADSVKAIQTALMTNFGDQMEFEVNVVSADLARELAVKTIWAILAASVLIMLYVMIRFEWRFALSANIAILYDCFVVVAMFSLFRLEVDLPFIAAVLTVLGYSINDKIVIFDRIRENLRFKPHKNAEQLQEIVNASIWQTMARNLYTVLTVFIVTLLIFLFGSESIRLFSLAILIGLVSGAYSTICLASPLWFEFKKREKNKKPKAASPSPKKEPVI
ncbi:protein translocase subunit SecF [Paenibacillus endoradicis]|uniref:protein translocase subunit SecF n=1 Tax=Paenibacillus endoradicis TaxID=2972487 RepID=UPI002158E55D|nr:protein translocase subunit SecF [Paenibacillus endoradicis]MCR8655745.1 protein translocase subunit SecF [Paenibacillus endoradicis]MCR8658071.1 protein translocase subunit SecF [Paenibacillus endoradicis]